MQRQLADAIRVLVQSGALAPGATLPGARPLARQLEVSRTTVDECSPDPKSPTAALKKLR